MHAVTSRICAKVQSAFSARRAELEERDDEGAAMAEYVTVTLAALACATILIVLFRSPYMNGLVKGLIAAMLNKFLKV